MSKFWVLVGSFSPFITTLQFTASPPTLSFVSQATSGTSPSWVAQSPKFPTTIYATDEVEAGSINTLSLDINTGNLTKLANISTQGNSPTHLGFINQGAAIGAANFGNGSAFIVNLETTNTGQFTGTGAKVAFQGSGPNPNSQTGPHAHQIVQHGDEVLVPDLGSDKIWRLVQQGSTWAIQGSIDHPAGSGPRHLIVVDNSVYTVHELASTVTQHILVPGQTSSPPLAANVSVLPPDLPANASMFAAELLYASSPTPLLYASNRNLALDPANPGDGDTITILSITPSLQPVGFVKTGLAQIRAMAFMGDNDQFILAAGLVGGGINVYERVSKEQGWLKKVTSLNDTRITQPTSFVAVDQSKLGTATSAPTPTSSASGKGCRRMRRLVW